MNDRMREWAEIQCEKIAAEDNAVFGDGTATCEVAEIRGTAVLFRLENEGGTFYGWLHDGESYGDIRWYSGAGSGGRAGPYAK